ncbi:FtsK/SpoIIIE domain-containing protein [Acrocarpospora sp. B8E8]|uniref:FtsK/SpoIIIE domain-containing protein n=1 Tax=Acrocarpospora sp. B8E8 TaxID=3153572 RepID=UPI00325D509B
MRIAITVVGSPGTVANRDVIVEGDESTTVAALARALENPNSRPSNVVRLPRARAPYGMDREAQEPAHTEVWLDGQRLDPAARVFGLLREGDRIALDRRAAMATVIEEPAGMVELRVVGGPGAGAVHRLGLGTHVIGSDPACAVTVPDPGLGAEAVIIRLVPSGITVEAGSSFRTPPDPAKPTTRSSSRSPINPPSTSSPHSSPKRPNSFAGGSSTKDPTGLRGSTTGFSADDPAYPSGSAGGSSANPRGHSSGEAGGSSANARALSTGGAGQAPTLDGEPVGAPVAWGEGVMLACGNSVFSVGAIEPPDAHLDALPDGGLAYNRPPRLRLPERVVSFAVPQEPKRAEGMRLQLLAAFLPAVFGVVMAVVFNAWYFLLIAFMTPMIMIGQWISDRRHGRKQHRQALKEFRQETEDFTRRVDAARTENEKARRAAAPDPAELLLTATGPRRRLWERRTHDQDALRLRVGLADLPAEIEFEPAQQDPPTARNVPVALAMRRLGVAGLTGPRRVALGTARWLVGQAAALHSPRDLAIVVISAHPDGADQWGWVRWLPHCVTHVTDSVALIGADPDAAARRVAELAALITERLDEENAPLLRPGRLTGGPAGWNELGRGTPRPAEPTFGTYDERPYDVLVVLDGAQVLRGLPGMPQVLRQGPPAGVYTIAIDDDQALLPEECATVVSCAQGGTLRLRGGGLDALGRIRADQVSARWADRMARALAPLRDVSRDDDATALPSAARLLDLIDLTKPPGRGTRAIIGIGPEGPYAVDLRRDGPHALIAGTTGAGKSELLQTLISSLAVANRPDEMTFVLIDYKGGAAFKECVRLPHTVGMVSDLDGHLTQRALTSLAAEIRRRERLLLDAGAKDIDDYLEARDAAERGTTWVLGASGVTQTKVTGLFDRPSAGAVWTTAKDQLPPLPRLVLIIDEFAALVAELPDFVDGLVDIARRGRSLGIHLILATQRPGGVVTADIQANTSLRIALRVTDTHESADVIDGPEAAHIPKTLPGRCYVRSGSGPAIAVQAARIGGRAPGGANPSGEVRISDLPWAALGHPLTSRNIEISGTTDLARLVDQVRTVTRSIPEQPSPWLPPLPDQVLLPTGSSTGNPSGSPIGFSIGSSTGSAIGLSAGLPTGSPSGNPIGLATGGPSGNPIGLSTGSSTGSPSGRAGEIPFGVSDLPWAQRTRPLTLGTGHLLIAGTARSGRSTALRTIAGSIAAHTSADDMHLHVIDCGSGALLPLVALPHCGAVVTRDQLDRVERLLTRLRAEVGRRQHVLADAGYASLAEARAGGLREPWLTLMLDRWEGYVAAFENYDYGRMIDAMLQLLREGPAVGLRAVVTSDRSGLLGQISTVFEDRLVLRLADPADYGLAGLPPKNLPASMPNGRALAMSEQGIVESQIALLAEDPSGPAQVAALQALARAASKPQHQHPLRVDALPTRITAAQVMDLTPDFTPPSPLWTLIGAGGDALTPSGLDLLAHGPAAVVAGPARSGRSSTLLTAAQSFLDRGVPVLIIAPRRSPLRELRGVLAVLDGNARSLREEATGEGSFGGIPGAIDPLELLAKHTKQNKANQSNENGEEQGKHQDIEQDPTQRKQPQQDPTQGKHQGFEQDATQAKRQDIELDATQAKDQGVDQGATQARHQDIEAGATQGTEHQEAGTAQGTYQDIEPDASRARHQDVEQGAQGRRQGVEPGAAQGKEQHEQGAAHGKGSDHAQAAPQGEESDQAQGVAEGNGLDDEQGAGQGREQGRYVVIVDDAELISPDSALGSALDEILRTARDGEHGLLIAGTTGDLATAYRSFVAEARKSRTGVLLSVQSPADGDLFNVRLPRGATGGPPGRGLLVVSGSATPIQAAVPNPS